MTAIDTFTLDRENPKIEFTLNSKDSFLLIENIHLITQKNENDYWKSIVSSIEINVVLKYIVYVDLEGRFIDERTKVFSIPLMPLHYQIQPIISVNRRITNETLSIGRKPFKKFYTNLIIELTEIFQIDCKYSLQFEVEKFNINTSNNKYFINKKHCVFKIRNDSISL